MVTRKDAKDCWAVWVNDPLTGDRLVKREYTFCTQEQALMRFRAEGHAREEEHVYISNLSGKKPKERPIASLMCEVMDREDARKRNRRASSVDYVIVSFHPLARLTGQVEHVIASPGKGYRLFSIKIVENGGWGAIASWVRTTIESN